MLHALAVDNYRSLRRLRLRLGQLTVVTGANGTGKSSLYRAFRLLADASHNGVVAALAREGGVFSALWAGPRDTGRDPESERGWQTGTERLGPVALRLGFGSDDFGYAVDLGIAPPCQTAFALDPEIKSEVVWAGSLLRPATVLADRRGPLVRARSSAGDWQHITDGLRPYDSMLSEVADLARAPELVHVRELLRSWRFYDHLRTDVNAPARAVPIGTHTPVLSDDGADLAAALETIRHIGDAAALSSTVRQAFPGSALRIDHIGGRLELLLTQPGLQRPLAVTELSDGTLRFLLLTAALLSPRPPALLVLNEPETSLHPELVPALADLMVRTSRHTQLIVVTHSEPLVVALTDRADEDQVNRVALLKHNGRTTIDGQGPLDEPAWHFPDR
jgi:predicted ATPase